MCITGGKKFKYEMKLFFDVVAMSLQKCFIPVHLYNTTFHKKLKINNENLLLIESNNKKLS